MSGRILITNYDPATLPEMERIRLHETADQRPVNDVSFDIRAGHYGGDWPLHGDFRLRSFNAMLNFLGRSVEEEAEHHVEKDLRTPPVAENPVKTMALLVVGERAGQIRPVGPLPRTPLRRQRQRASRSLESRSVQTALTAFPDDHHRPSTHRSSQHYDREIMDG